jgi:hypothetical protein
VIDVHCNGRLHDGTRCQEICHADESHVGRSIRCPKCGTVNRIERSLPVQSTYQSRTGTVPIPTAEWRPAKPVSRSTSSHSRRKNVAIIAGVLFGVFGIAVALDRLLPDSSKKSGAESSSTVEQSVVPSRTSQPQGIPPPVVEPTPPISNPWRQSGNVPPARSNPGDVAPFPTMNQSDQQMPIRPCARDQQVDRPRTGTRLEPDEESSGVSKLRIKNGTQRDAAIRLVEEETGRAARFVYVEAGDEYTVGNIEVGSYLLRFASGYDWIPACTDFIREPEYSEFESALTFEVVTRSKDRDGYTTRYEVTLNQVPFGNAKKRTIDRKRFFEGDQHVTLIP